MMDSFKNFKKKCVKVNFFSEKYFKFISIYTKLQVFLISEENYIKHAWNILELWLTNQEENNINISI